MLSESEHEEQNLLLMLFKNICNNNIITTPISSEHLFNIQGYLIYEFYWMQVIVMLILYWLLFTVKAVLCAEIHFHFKVLQTFLTNA